MADRLGDAARPAQRGKFLETPKISLQQRTLRHHRIRGRCSSRSKKPCSISLSCVSRLICVLPISVSNAHSPRCSEASPTSSAAGRPAAQPPCELPHPSPPPHPPPTHPPPPPKHPRPQHPTPTPASLPPLLVT